MNRRARRWLAVGAALAASGPFACAESLRFCEHGVDLTAEQRDRLLNVAAIVRDELAASGARVAIVARSGQDLARFGLRYSHAGISLEANDEAPWSVRQLYYACAERKPRLFDQGIAGFVVGTDNPSLGYVSIVLLPSAEADRLEARALDRASALAMLGATYSANAYPFDTRYQNCNQWVVELLAAAWGELDESDAPRERAQAWLRSSGYEPTVVDVGSRLLMLAGMFVPWVHSLDHPVEDRAALHYKVSMPESIEAFVRATVPGAERIEICHHDREVVLHRGWEPIADGCHAAEGDRVITLD